MKFKGVGEIHAVNFCEKEVKGADPLKEEALTLLFNAKEYPEIVGMTQKEIISFMDNGENKGFNKDKGSKILSGIYNITIDGQNFPGNQFSSCEVKRVKNVGDVIVLRCRIPYDEDFHRTYPTLFRKMIDFEITEVNEQMTLLGAREEETEKQDSQSDKRGVKYSQGRTCDFEECGVSIRNDNKSGRCKNHPKKK